MKTAVCAIIKDEQRFLKEWIDWHLCLGFNSIYLFEDKTSSSHEDICNDYNTVYLCKYGDNEKVRELLEFQSSYRQEVLYDWFAKKNIGIYDWIAFIDIDEFINFSPNYSLSRLCSEFKQFPAVHLSWKMKGASGHIKRPNCNVVDAYTEDAEFLPGEEGWRVKSLINISEYRGLRDLHHTIGGVSVMGIVSDDHLIYEKAWINHYFTKSWEDWCDRIFNRGGTVPGHRILSQFFECNPTMKHLQYELIREVSDRIPKGTYWIDKQRAIIAGGNINKIKKLNQQL